MFQKLQPDRGAKIKGVLFDMDGVVIDTETLFARFWVEAAHALGYPMTREQALQLRSLSSLTGQPKMESFFGPGVSYDEIRNKRIELMDAWIEVHGVEEKPGIRELLRYLKENDIPCAITSSSSLPVIRRHLTNLGLIDGFTALCSGRDLPRGKPAPDIYLHGAERIGVAPEECLAIEDSPAGIESAWRAGCMAVIVPDQDQPDELTLSRSFAKADSLLDVMELLKRECALKLADVLSELRNWLRAHDRELSTEVLIDSEDCLRVIFETKHALAELLVQEAEFAPYRFVSFMILDTRLDERAAPVFCFHDNENHTIEDILRELDRGLRSLTEQ